MKSNSNIVFNEMDATTLHERLLEAVAAIFPGHGPSMENMGLDYIALSLESVQQFGEIQAEVEEAGMERSQGFRRFKKRREWREVEWAYSRDLEFVLSFKAAINKRGLPPKLCGLVVGLAFGLLRSVAAHHNIEIDGDHLHEWQREIFGDSVPGTVESNPWQTTPDWVSKLLLASVGADWGTDPHFAGISSLLWTVKTAIQGHYEAMGLLLLYWIEEEYIETQEGHTRATLHPHMEKGGREFLATNPLLSSHVPVSSPKAQGPDTSYGENLSATLRDTSAQFFFLASWIKGGRSVIDVTPQSALTLRGVHMDRVIAGKPLVRFDALPGPGHRLYKRCVVFKFHGFEVEEIATDARENQRHAQGFYSGDYDPSLSKPAVHYVFMAATGVPFAEEVASFMLTRPTQPWGDPGSHSFLAYRAPFMWGKEGATYNPAEGEEEVLEGCDLPDTLEDCHSKEVVFMAANALAAMASDIEVTVHPKRKKKGARGSRGSSRRNRPKTIRLGDKGLRTWRRRLVDEDRRSSPHVTHSPRLMPLQHVPEHTTTVWVLDPLPHEKILGSRPRTGKKEGMLYAVERVRGKGGGYVRGSELVPNRSRMKQGLDDLNLPPIV